jgi:vacuolar-type H+-ATPase catalytic subunit A/Vma1
LWDWKPSPNVKVGSLVSGGDIIGSVYENELFNEHRILVPPKNKGKVKFIAPPGNYTIDEIVLEIEHNNKT